MINHSFFGYIKNGDIMKTILFTGARGGIISSVIDNLKNKRYKIYVTVHTETQLESIKKKYNKYSNIECLKLDVTSKEDRQNIKNLDIDILVLNGAIGYGGSICEMDMDLVRNNFEVNVFSNFEIVQLFIGNMIHKNKGKIIFMSSLAAIYPTSFIGAYSATKASINRLALTLKKELSLINSNIKISIIEPGFYHTGFNQVMFQNKYDWMDTETYFNSCIDIIRKKEHFIEKYIEKKNLNSVKKKILCAIKDKNPNTIYRVPFFQSFMAKGYQILFE